MQLASLSPIPASAAPLTAAERYVRDAAWLLAPGSVVQSLDVLDDLTVRVVVADPFAHDPHDRADADRLAADSARTVLEQTAPGVQRYDLEPRDNDGDGQLAPGEYAHTVEVDSEADASRIGWLLRDRFDEGSVHDGPVVVHVSALPWQLAPVRGAR
jgi:hypothetical protein